MSRIAIACILCIASPALAERRMLSLDVSGGWAFDPVPASNAVAASSTFSMGPVVMLGARYGVKHYFDIALTGFFETPVQVGHNNIVLHTESGDFAGTLVHQSMRFGAMAGPRFVMGVVWRLSVGIDFGWAQRLSTGLKMIDDSNASAPIDYGLTLADTSRANFVVSPVIGVEWAGGDHWALGLMPRVQISIGKDGGWSIFLPLQLSWGWFI